MITIDLDPQAEAQLITLLKRMGIPQDAALREAVLQLIEDLQDIEIADQRLKTPGRRWTMEEIKRGADSPDVEH
ncbi:MAG: hypothetical protein JO089_03255 [Alphaproteobacteria bacterium]|nr:hypothetical protein [Alphaproteobacteria bacterium]